ncbi:guanylate cyclase [bacterium D16-34]|nr:guanylate cyclase [bacterium D16-34]
MLVRLSRIIPFLLVLAVLAAIIYLVMTYRHSPTRAKEILIKLFIGITSVTSVFFALMSLYAWFEHNDAVFDLAFSFLLTMLICLGVTLWCRAVFLKHHPEYRKKPQRAKRLNSRGGRK